MREIIRSKALRQVQPDQPTDLFPGEISQGRAAFRTRTTEAAFRRHGNVNSFRII